MSTYLPGLTDYIPQVQPFSPDYNFYSGALDVRQGKHDAAKKQLSNLYGSLLNAPLTRKDNTETRDQFFKTIEQDIHKMAGMDLSLAQNAQAATGIFNQMLENKPLVRDMVWTKGYQKQMEKSNYLKNCIDPEKCGGAWWEGGDRLMQYSREAFANATPDQAMQMNVPKYIAYQDITKKAMAIAEEADLNVTYDQISGGYITTTKNGQAVQGSLQDLFGGTLGKDPKIKEFYNAQAEVQRKDWMHQNQGQYGSLENAEQAYISSMIPGIEAYYQNRGIQLQDAVTVTQRKEDKITKALETSTEDDRSALEKARDDFSQERNGYSSSLQEAKTGNNEILAAKRNKQYSGQRIDRLLSGMQLNSDIGSAAKTLSMKDFEFSIKEDPYAMESVKQQNRLALEEVKFQNKATLAKLSEDTKAIGGIDSNMPIDVAANGMVDQTANQETKGFDSAKDDRNAKRQDLSAQEKGEIFKVHELAAMSAEHGDEQAQKDVVSFTRNMILAQQANPEKIGVKGRSDLGEDYEPSVDDIPMIDAERLKIGQRTLQELNRARTDRERYDIAKRFKFDLSSISGAQMDAMYKGTVIPMTNKQDAVNKVMRKYLSTSLLTDSRHARSVINSKEKALDNWDSQWNKSIKQAINNAHGSGEYEKIWLDGAESFYDEKGHVRDKQAFVKQMVAKGYGKLKLLECIRVQVKESQVQIGSVMV